MRYLSDFKIGVLDGFKEFGEIFPSILNFIILTVIYFVGIGFSSVLKLVLRKEFMELKTDKKKKSYWEDLNIGKNKDNIFKQY